MYGLNSLLELYPYICISLRQEGENLREKFVNLSTALNPDCVWKENYKEAGFCYEASKGQFRGIIWIPCVYLLLLCVVVFGF